MHRESMCFFIRNTQYNNIISGLTCYSKHCKCNTHSFKELMHVLLIVKMYTMHLCNASDICLFDCRY